MFSVVACSTSQHEGDNNKEPEINLSSIRLSYMNNLMVNLNGNTALGIKKTKVSNNEKNVSVKTSKAVKLFTMPLATSTDTKNKDDELNTDEQLAEKFYLYSTTQTYSNGTVEYDDNSIKKVTFKKSTQSTEDIYDSNGDLVDANTTVTQDDLDAQVNKLFVTREFTFVQFVALVECSGDYQYYDENGKIQTEYVELRPSGLTYDENGVAEFDKSNYYSSALSQSFVIDNTSGYIYKIENFKIAGFKNGLITIDNSIGYYNLYVQNKSLMIEDVLPNKDVKVSNVFKDYYGWTFVANDKIDDISNEHKIIYTTDSTHKKIASNGVVYNTKYYDGTLMEHITEYYESGVVKQYTHNHFVNGIRNLFMDDVEEYCADYYGVEIYNLNLYAESGILLSSNGSHIVTNKANDVEWFDTQHDFIYQISDEGKLSYIPVNLYECTEKVVSLNDNNFILLSEKRLTKMYEDYYIFVGIDKYKVTNVFYYAGIDGTTYYQLVRKGDNLELREITSVSYASNTFILQPINH